MKAPSQLVPWSKGRVRVGSQPTPPITIECGVLHVSVLSPVLFLMIMNPLLKSLESSQLGPFIGDTYAGAFVHADNVRTLTSSLLTLQKQIDSVKSFANENTLILNHTKFEVLSVSTSKPQFQAPAGILGNQALVAQQQVKCLVYWWSWDLSAKKTVEPLACWGPSKGS